MKKLLFILLLIIPAFVINAQDVEPKEEVTTVQVIDHIYDKTSEAITELAQALAVPAEHVYNVLVRQQILQSISAILIFTLVSLICYITMQVALKDWKKANIQWAIDNERPDKTSNYDFDDDWWAYAFWTAVAIWIIGIAVFLGCIGTITTGIFNPEYGAIKDIMSIL